MRERLEQILRIVCLLLAALLVVKLSGMALHKNVLAGIKIPAVPALSNATNDAAANPSREKSKGSEKAVKPDASNTTNTTSSVGAKTSLTAKATNAPVAKPGGGPAQVAGARGAGNRRHGQPGMGGSQAKAADLPPEVQARIDRIYQSELLGPVFHPAPMGLLGIAGRFAFLRAPNGQTGMVKEGGELGGLKLVRIGVNRVLVEEGGKQQELTVFNGFGGESLLPKSNENPK